MGRQLTSPPRDPGLQPERTALAWQRTALALTVNGVVAARSAAIEHSIWMGAVSGATLLAALAVYFIARRRRITLMSPGDTPLHNPGAPNARVMQAMIAATLMLSTAALLLAWASMPDL